MLALESLLDLSAEAPDAVASLAAERQAARAAGDYARADELRAQIERSAGRCVTRPTAASS